MLEKDRAKIGMQTTPYAIERVSTMPFQIDRLIMLIFTDY